MAGGTAPYVSTGMPSGGRTFWQPTPTGSGGASASSPTISQGQNYNQNQSVSQQQSNTYIPDYSQTPILNEIAQYSRGMAPQIYEWGMDQFNKNQGNIDTMMRNALSYASPQRTAQEMGMAEAGVMQGAETGRQNAIKDLQSYGIDPSSGRYASLDQASRVMAGASAAGAGNQQRMATQAQGNAMQQQAISASMQNVNTGYGAAKASNDFLGTAMQLKYPPLGSTSSSSTIASGSGGGYNESYPTTPYNTNPPIAGTGSTPSSGGTPLLHTLSSGMARGGAVGYDRGGGIDGDATTGGFVSNELSPSSGAQTDDVDARLNAGEFVIPKDVSAWLGQEYFYKLMAKARAARATAGSETAGPGGAGNEPAAIGYGAA